MLKTAPFEGSRLKLARARRHAAELQSEVAAYLSGDPCILSVERYDDTGNHRVALRWREGAKIPTELAAVFGDVVHNLRVALDLMANDLVALSGTQPKNVYFPFADDAGELEGQMRRRMKGAPADILDMIRALKPYHGGNVPLRALHDLDIADKHVGLIQWASQGWIIPPMRRVPSGKPNQILLESDWTLLPRAPIDTSEFRVEQGVTILGKVPGNHCALCIGKGFPLSGEQILAAISKLGALVQGIVQTFEAHCLGSKQPAP